MRHPQCVSTAIATMLAALLPGTALAGNLVFNSGFELDDAGTGFIKVVQPETNPTLVYERPVSDSSTFASGSKSLRIPNRFAEKCALFFKEFKLKPGVEYTFSASMKSAIPGCKVNFDIASATTEAAGWDVTAGSFDVGTEWTRHSIAFTTKSPWPNEWYRLNIEFCKEKDEPAGDLWLDDVQIVEGKSAEHSCGSEIEAAAIAERSYYVQAGQALAKASLRALNNGKSAADLKLRVRAVEDSTGFIAFSRDFPVHLQAGQSQTIPFELPLQRFGAYRLETELLDSAMSFASHPGFLAFAGVYERKQIDIGKTFCVGLNFEGAHYDIPANRQTHKPGYVCDGYSQEGYMRLFADMGCRLAREWGGGFRWKDLAPLEGKYDFSLLDRTLDMYSRHGIYLMPILGHSDLVDDGTATSPYLPAWLLAISPKKEKCGDWKRDMRLPPLEQWRSYVKAIVSHCKGRVGFYEIMNEPNGWMDPADYINFLKAANEEIRKGDPSAKIVGFCSTGDLGGNMTGFLGTCYKEGALKYADIVSFHPYDAPHLGAPKSADRQLDEARALIKSYSQGREIPLWDTELYYIYKAVEGNYIESEKHKPAHIAWRFLTELGEGVSQECFLEQHQIFKNLLSPHFASHYQSQTAPSGDFVVYNALARLFEGAKPKAKHRWGSDAICYVYEKDGHGVAAFWNYTYAKGLSTTLPLKDGDAQLYDLFGNKLSLKEQPLQLGDAPFYLTWTQQNDAKVQTALRNAKLDSEKPISFSEGRIVPMDNNSWGVAFTMGNASSSQADAQISLKGGGLSSGVAELPAAPNASTPGLIPVALDGSKIGETSLKLAFEGKIQSYQMKLHPAGKVYCVKEGEGASESLAIQGRKVKSDHSASFKASYGENALNLSIDVKDATPSGASAGRQPWEQDCIELFIDADPMLMPAKAPEVYHGKVARVFIMPYEESGKQVSVSNGDLKLLTPESMPCKIARRSDGYSISLTIPFESLELVKPVKGKLIGFEIAVDSTEGAKEADQQLLWSSSGDAYKNRLDMGFIAFK